MAAAGKYYEVVGTTRVTGSAEIEKFHKEALKMLAVDAGDTNQQLLSNTGWNATASRLEYSCSLPCYFFCLMKKVGEADVPDMDKDLYIPWKAVNFLDYVTVRVTHTL